MRLTYYGGPVGEVLADGSVTVDLTAVRGHLKAFHNPASTPTELSVGDLITLQVLATHKHEVGGVRSALKRLLVRLHNAL